jgi:hypothetical protein
VAERVDTQLLEVISRQLQQNALVDLVIAERLLVALQPEPLPEGIALSAASGMSLKGQNRKQRRSEMSFC